MSSSQGEDDAVLRHRRDEDNRRVRRQPGTGLADQPVDLLEADGLQTRRQLAAQLIERVTLRFGGAPLGQFVILANDQEHQQEDHRRRDQNGGEQQPGAARPPAVVRWAGGGCSVPARAGVLS